MKDFLKIIWVSFLLSAVSPCLSVAQDAGTKLRHAGEAILAYPPEYQYGAQRLQVMEILDGIFDFSVSDCDYVNNPEYATRMKHMVEFYRNRVETGLQFLENSNVTEGVYVVKFYSSSVILKSPEGTIAVDFAQGPVGNDYKQGSVANEGEPETSDFFSTGFYLTPEQRDRLAALVDVYLVTHPHQDHADYSLARRMVQSGKPVIGPEQLKLKWEDLQHGITVPDFGKVQSFKGCEILAQAGFQYSNSKDEGGQRVGYPTRYLSRDVESIRYLIRVNGIVFLHAAETHTEGYEFLAKAAASGWKTDVLLRAGALQGARSVMQYFEDHQARYFTLPIHEYEITHPGGGQRMAHLLKGPQRNLFDRQMAMPLFWGEHFHLVQPVVRE